MGGWKIPTYHSLKITVNSESSNSSHSKGDVSDKNKKGWMVAFDCHSSHLSNFYPWVAFALINISLPWKTELLMKSVVAILEIEIKFCTILFLTPVKVLHLSNKLWALKKKLLSTRLRSVQKVFCFDSFIHGAF